MVRAIRGYVWGVLAFLGLCFDSPFSMYYFFLVYDVYATMCYEWLMTAIIIIEYIFTIKWAFLWSRMCKMV